MLSSAPLVPGHDSALELVLFLGSWSETVPPITLPLAAPCPCDSSGLPYNQRVGGKLQIAAVFILTFYYGTGHSGS